MGRALLHPHPSGLEVDDPAALRGHPRGAPPLGHVPPGLIGEPLSEPGSPPLDDEAARRRGHVSPVAGLGLAVAGLIAGILLAGILGGIALAATGDEKGPVLLAASFIGLWIPLVTVSLLASRHFGTGSSRDDLGLWVRGTDLGRGAVVAIIGILATSATQLALSPFDELLGTNTNFIREQVDTLPGAVLVVASTMIGAPLVEEIFFRGLVQGALIRLGGLAVVLQAFVFGLIHFDPDLGLGNVGVVLGVGTFGLVQGLAVRHFGRLGPAFWSHSFFNAAAVVPILVSG